VGPKHFQNAARREWWSIHMEAWQRSGLSLRRYCAQHRLTETTFDRWRKAFGVAKAQQIKAELLREERRERRRKRRIRLSTGMRSKAVQAFWAMHVEAMTWCGNECTGLRQGTWSVGAQPEAMAQSPRCWRSANRPASASSSECPSANKH
jgi:hypothetical protein